METTSNVTFTVLFPKYASLLKIDKFQTNESIENFIKNELPLQVEVVKKLEATFNSFLNQYTNLIVKRPQISNLSYSLASKATDLLDKLFKDIELRCQKLNKQNLNGEFQDTNPRRTVEAFLNSLRQMEQLIRQKYINNPSIPRQQQQKVAELLYTILEIYHFAKSDLVTIASKHQLEQAKICNLAFNNGTPDVSQLFSIAFIDQGFKEYINSIVQKRCRPFYHKKDFFNSKIKQSIREAEGRLNARTQPSALIFVESLLSKQKHRITKITVPQVQNILKTLTEIPQQSGCRDIIERVQALKRKFMQVKNNPYYIDIIRGDFTKKYKMELNKLENLYYLSNIQKYLQDVMEFVDQLLKLEEAIIQNRKRFKDTLSSKVETQLYQLCQGGNQSHEKLTGIMSYYFGELESLLYLIENKPDEQAYREPTRYGQKLADDNYMEDARRKREEQQRKIEEQKRKRNQAEADQRRIRQEQRKAAQEARRLKQAQEQEKKKQKMAKQRAERQKLQQESRKKAQQERKKRAEEMEKRQRELQEKKKLDDERKKVQQKQRREIQEQRKREDEERKRKEDQERKKRMQEQQRIKKQEEQRKKIELQKRRKEQQQKQQKNRKQEEQRRKVEEQRKRKEGEQKRKREQQQRKRKQEEDKKKRELQQRKRKEDEQRKKKEDEDRKQKQADEKKKKQNEERKRRQQEQRVKKQAEEKRKRQDEEKRKRQQQDKKRKQEEDRKKRQAQQKRKKQQEQRKRKDQQDRKRKQAEEKKRKEEQDLAKKKQQQRKRKEQADRIQAEQKRKKQEKRIEQEKRKQKQQQQKKRKLEEQKKRKQQQDRKAKEAQQKRKKDEQAKKKLEQQKRKKEQQENKRKAEEQRKKKQALEREQKQKEELKRKQEQQAKAKKGGKNEPKKSAINYADLGDELIDEDEVPKKNPSPPKKPAKDDDDQYLQQYDEEFDDFSPDKEEQQEGDQQKTQPLIQEQNLKSLNDYMKGTSYARKNKPNLQAFNNRTQYAYLFQQFTQNGKFYIYSDSSIAKAIYDFGKQLQDENTPQQNLQLTLETIQQAITEDHVKTLNEAELDDEVRVIFPLSFANQLNIYLVEVLRTEQYLVIVFKEEPPAKEEYQLKLENFVEAFRHLYQLQQLQLATLIVSPQTRAVLQTFDKQLPNLLLIFALHYQQQHNLSSPITINQYTIQRFFYILHILQPFYDMIMNEQEKVQEFYDNLMSKYANGDKLRSFVCQADLAKEDEEDCGGRIVEAVRAVKEQFLKSKTAKNYFVMVQLVNSAEEEEVPFRKIVIYFSITKEDTGKPALNYYIVSSNEQQQRFASKIFQWASDEIDDEFQRTIYMDFTRHNGLSEYSQWSISLWPHVVEKRKLSPVQAFRAITLAMTPYYMALKQMD